MTKAELRERGEFVRVMCEELDSVNGPRLARILMRHAHTHGRLAVESCNGHPAQGSPTMDVQRLNKLQERWDARIEREERRIEALIVKHCRRWGIVPNLGGDPRGYTVKLHLKSGHYNTWGGKEEGYGVPQ